MKNGITFVMIAKNEEAVIESNIQSILQFSGSDFEIILVNSGSTDRSPYIMRKYSDEHTSVTFTNSRKPGPSAARNEGLRLANLEYVFFLDGDVELENGFIAAALDEFKNSPNTCAIAGKLAEEQYTPNYSRIMNTVPDRYNRNAKTRVKRFGGIFLARREATINAGEWDERLFCHEDTDYAIRLGMLGHLIVIPEKMGTHKTVKYENRMTEMIRSGYFRGVGLFVRKYILKPTIWIPFLISHRYLYPVLLMLLTMIWSLLFHSYLLLGILAIAMLDITIGLARGKTLKSWLLSHYVAPAQVLVGFLCGNKT